MKLPSAEMEQRFWEDTRTVSSFTGVDIVAAGYVLLGNLGLLRPIKEATQTLMPVTWHVHVVVAVNIVAAVATLALILAKGKFYRRHRHAIVIANRLLRVACMVMLAVCATPAKHALLGWRVAWVPDPLQQSEAAVAVLTLTRPLFLTALVTLGLSDWVFPAARWLPMQFVTVALACLGTYRFQPCQLANDPHSVMILQSTCRAVTWLQHMLLGLVVGQQLMPLNAPSGAGGDACSDVFTAARALGMYTQAVYCLLVAGATHLPFEWRLKARWVQQHYGMRLVYRPLRHKQRKDGATSRGWLLPLTLVPVVLWGLWLVCLRLAALLPHEPCATCAGTGSCPSLAPCDGLLCVDPGAAAAILLFLQMAAICAFKVFVSRSIYALV